MNGTTRLGSAGARALRRAALIAATSAVAYTSLLSGAWSQSLESALAQAYKSNPTLNAQRAQVRSVDENVPQALAGYRPRVTGQLNAGRTWAESKVPGTVAGTRFESEFNTRGASLTAQQTLFDGFRTRNTVNQAEAAVLQAREALRSTEQQTLFNAVTAYMNVLRDFAILDLRRNNVELLEEQLRATRERFQVGEVTRTDVAQSESRLAGSRSDLAVAEGNLKTSRAVFRQVIGSEPGRLVPGRPVDKLVPRSLDAALNIGHGEHPAILAALYNVDVAQYNVKVQESALYPTVSVQGSASSTYEPSVSFKQQNSASVVGVVTVPIYQGGGEYSRVRQAKETLGQRRIEADTTRDQVRASIVSAWGALESAKAQIIAAQAQVEAAQTAFNGVSEEAKVGQRTTLDVLNAQQELLNARVALVTAQRDRVVASYNVVQAIGRLSLNTLAVRTESYDPSVHYDQVRDKWFGLRTPDGR